MCVCVWLAVEEDRVRYISTDTEKGRQTNMRHERGGSIYKRETETDRDTDTEREKERERERESERERERERNEVQKACEREVRYTR